MDRLYKVDEKNCWLWLGGKFITGYGCYKRTFAHRVFYETYNGKLTKGHHIHHTCHTKLCVNPKHLLEVTRQEHNKLHHQTERKVCKKGHLMANNTYITKAGHWQCMICNKTRQKRYNDRDAFGRRQTKLDVVEGVRRDYGTMPVKDIAKKWGIGWRSVYRYTKAIPKKLGYL